MQRFAVNHRRHADHRVIHPRVRQAGIGPDDAVRDHRAGHKHALAKAHMRPNDAVLQRHIRPNEARRNHHRVPRDQAFMHHAVRWEVVKDVRVGRDRRVFVATIQPGVHFAHAKAKAVALHVFERVGELEFAFFLEVVVDEVLQFALEAFTVREVINPDNRQVADELLGFFNEVSYHPLAVGFDDAELARVLDARDPNGPVEAWLHLKISAEEGVGEGDDDLALESRACAEDGVGGAKGFVLVMDGASSAELFGDGDEIGFGFGAKCAVDDVGDFVYGVLFAVLMMALADDEGRDVLHKPLNDRLSRHGHERLGRGEGVGPHAFAHARHGDDDVHGAKLGGRSWNDVFEYFLSLQGT